MSKLGRFLSFHLPDVIGWFICFVGMLLDPSWWRAAWAILWVCFIPILVDKWRRTF